MKFFKYEQKGFTLIELLVVIAILGTLAGVVVLNVIQFIGKGGCEAAKTELSIMQTAATAMTYESATHTPPTAAELAAYSSLTTVPKGTYTVTGSGQVAQTHYTGLSDAALAACP